MSGDGAQASPVDAAALMARLEGDRELLAELLELFAADSESLLEDLENGVSARDPDAVHRAAHTLKGAVANFSAPAAVAAALALETAGRGRDLSSAPALLAGLRTEIDAVRRALAALAL